MNDLHVLIVGAGVTGLLIAQGLKKAGIKFTIFETEPSASFYRPREWSMAIHWSLPVLKALLPPDLVARLKEAQNNPSWDAPEKDNMVIYNGLNGEVLKAIPIPLTIRVSRRKMRAFCCQGIDVKYGFTLSGIEYGEDGNGVTASFTNGESATGTLIIGTDGPRSKVREILLGNEKGAVIPMEIVHSNVAIVYHDAEKAKFIRSAHPVFSLMSHPSLLCFIAMQDVPSESDPANWCFQIVTSRIGQLDTTLDEHGRLAQVKEQASVLAEPFRSAVQWIPDDTKITYNSIAYWIPVPWNDHEGRATLAGDAAHPMPPHRGQGLNHAIQDASNFVAAMEAVASKSSSLLEAVKVYNDEVVKRGSEEVLASRQNALALLNWDLINQSQIVQKGVARLEAPTQSVADAVPQKAM